MRGDEQTRLSDRRRKTSRQWRNQRPSTSQFIAASLIAILLGFVFIFSLNDITCKDRKTSDDENQFLPHSVKRTWKSQRQRSGV